MNDFNKKELVCIYEGLELAIASLRLNITLGGPLGNQASKKVVSIMGLSQKVQSLIRVSDMIEEDEMKKCGES